MKYYCFEALFMHKTMLTAISIFDITKQILQPKVLYQVSNKSP